MNIGPTIAVEKPAWRIQGGFEFVLAGITITDADAAADGGLVTCAFTTTRGWWSLPSALPLILLNGATGTKDALALSFRATFANMISIIAQIRFASVSDPGEDVVIVQVCNTSHTYTCTHPHMHMSLSFKCVTHHTHTHAHTHMSLSFKCVTHNANHAPLWHPPPHQPNCKRMTRGSCWTTDRRGSWAAAARR